MSSEQEQLLAGFFILVLVFICIGLANAAGNVEITGHER